MKKLLEKEIYETPVLMEISPVTVGVVHGDGDGSGDPKETGGDDPSDNPGSL